VFIQHANLCELSLLSVGNALSFIPRCFTGSKSQQYGPLQEKFNSKPQRAEEKQESGWLDSEIIQLMRDVVLEHTVKDECAPSWLGWCFIYVRKPETETKLLQMLETAIEQGFDGTPPASNNIVSDETASVGDVNAQTELIDDNNSRCVKLLDVLLSESRCMEHPVNLLLFVKYADRICAHLTQRLLKSKSGFHTHTQQPTNLAFVEGWWSYPSLMVERNAESSSRTSSANARGTKL